jgi:hypothetical protein
LARYDYIVGDWGYEQLRLKGFFEKDYRKALPDQRIVMLEDYLYEYCNFGCAYFVIQRVGGKKEKSTSRRRKKKPAQTNQNQTTQQNAHIEEKREAIPQKKSKPTIKNRKPKEKNVKKTETTTVKKGKKEFTIRQREE